MRLPRCPNSDLALCQGPLWTILSGRHGLVAIVDFATIRASDLGIMLGHVSEKSGEGLATVFGGAGCDSAFELQWPYQIQPH